MKKKVLMIISIVLFLSVLFFTYFFFFVKKEEKLISNFEECVLAGYPVIETYPRQCSYNNSFFAEDIGNEKEKLDLIFVNNPRPNDKIESPLFISGEARGFWFFEASFPIYLKDEKGEVISYAIATAKSDWMTENFVPFEAEIVFEKPESQKGELVFLKDNPSGLKEYDDELVIPVRF